MRKTLPLLIPLLLSAFSIAAQQVQPSGLRPIESPNQVRNPDNRLDQIKIDPQLLKSLANEKAFSRPGDASPRHKNSVNRATEKDAGKKMEVEIKGAVTPELLEIIKAAGGEIVSTSYVDNTIVAAVTSDALQKIAASPDVKKIAQVSGQKSEVTNSKNEAFQSGGFQTGRQNFISQKVRQERSQSKAPVKSATF